MAESVVGLSVDRLGSEICELAGQLAAASARWVLLIAEFDRLEGWARSGCQSMVHWLSWRCGIGMHAAREKVRVGHALAELPAIRASFARGELSYSQVRAVTRIAGPHNEAALVDCARASTAYQLERLVAATARSERMYDEGFAATQLAGRFFRTGFDYDLSMFTAKMSLTSDDGKVLTKALDLAAKQLAAERGDQGPDTTREQLLADALVAVASSFLATRLADRVATDQYRVVVFADDSVVEGPGNYDDDDDVDVDERDPDLRSAEGDQCGCGAGPSDDRGDELVRAVPRAHIEGGAMLTEATIRRIWCDTTVTRLQLRDGAIVAIEEPTRTISAAMRRALGLRDGQCRFPGCNSKRFDAHHIRYRRRGGPTTLTNLLSLCRFHHKLVHEGGYSVGKTLDGEIRFYDPTGRELHHGTGLAANDGADALRRRHRSLGIDIDPETIVGNCCGDRLDLAYATSVLARPLTRRHQPTPPQGPTLN